MDSSWGIPVEYKLDAFNMPRTGTTLCHPKIGYVDLSVIPLSTRMEITHTLPNYQTRNSRWHPKFNSYNGNMSFVKNAKKHNPSHVRRHTLPSQPSQLLITQFRLNTHNANKLKLHESCSTKSKPKYSMLQIKTLFQKHLSTFAILLHHSTFYFLTNLARA